MSQQPVTLLDCACETHVYGDGSGVEVTFCALHYAAPDLLAALKRAVDTIRAFHGIGLNGPAEAGVWDLYQQSPEMTTINAAIAKAERQS